MAGNIKFHAIAITLISLIVVILYFVMGPQQASSTAQAPSKYAIKITNATWGENCNPYMAEAIAQQRSATVDPNAPAQPAIIPVKPDNALKQVAAACDGKPACEIPATIDTFGDPLSGCFKSLVVGYRCFTYDLLTTKNIGQGELLQIDCASQAAAAHAPTKP